MKEKNVFSAILNSIYWYIIVFIKCCLNFVDQRLICPLAHMDWNNIVPYDYLQRQNDSSSSNGSNSTDDDSSSDEDADMEHSEYVFRPYALIKINYKGGQFGDYPVSRSGHRVIASDSNLFSLGGYNPKSAVTASRRGQCLLFQELWSYNFATNRWKLLLDSKAPNMPRELASNAMVIHNNVLISHGGTGYPFGENCSNDCHVFSTEQPSCTRLTVKGDMPTAQYGPGVVIHDNYLYTIGGTTGFDYSCDVYRLSLKTKVWESLYICRPELREDPGGRYRHEVVYDGKHIFVLGGGTSLSVYDLQRIPAFNLKTNTWNYFETKADPTIVNGIPKPRKCFSCVQYDTPNGIEAYIAGGLQSDFTTYFGDIWKINFKTLQWTLLKTAALPRPLYFHSAASPGNGCMYIFGGIEYNKTIPRRRNDLYKMWLTIPKLSEMCWDAITYYNPNIDKYKRNHLLTVGIPERFVNRVKSETTFPNSSVSTLPLRKRIRSFPE